MRSNWHLNDQSNFGNGGFQVGEIDEIDNMGIYHSLGVIFMWFCII